MSEEKITVSITDDHPLVISGLQTMLSRYPHISVAGSYGNGAALMEGLAQLIPDVLLLDIQMPDKTGDALVPLIVRKFPTVKTIILTNFDSALYLNNMLKLGAHGYLLKSAEEKQIVTAIEEVYRGNLFIDEQLRHKKDLPTDKVSKSVFNKVSLTPREKEVIQHIVNGETNQQIADNLFLSIRTVENYRLNIQLKLNVKNTAMLVKTAMQLGLLD